MSVNSSVQIKIKIRMYFGGGMQSTESQFLAE